jgi:hypothetical protein
VAEWLRSGLQSRVHRFDSGRRLERFLRVNRNVRSLHAESVALDAAASSSSVGAPVYICVVPTSAWPSSACAFLIPAWRATWSPKAWRIECGVKVRVDAGAAAEFHHDGAQHLAGRGPELEVHSLDAGQDLGDHRLELRQDRDPALATALRDVGADVHPARPLEVAALEVPQLVLRMASPPVPRPRAILPLGRVIPV